MQQDDFLRVITCSLRPVTDHNYQANLYLKTQSENLEFSVSLDNDRRGVLRVVNQYDGEVTTFKDPSKASCFIWATAGKITDFKVSYQLSKGNEVIIPT